MVGCPAGLGKAPQGARLPFGDALPKTLPAAMPCRGPGCPCQGIAKGRASLGKRRQGSGCSRRSLPKGPAGLKALARPCHGPDVRRYGPLGCRPGRCRGQDGPGHGHVNPARPRPGRPRRGRDVRRPRPARIRPMAPPPRTRPGRRRGIPIDCVTPRRPRPLPARSRRTPRHPRGAGTLDLFCRHTGPESKKAKNRQRFWSDFVLENESFFTESENKTKQKT